MILFCWFGWHMRGPWVRRSAWKELDTLVNSFDPVTGFPTLKAVPRRYYVDRLERAECENCGKVLYEAPLPADWHWA